MRKSKFEISDLFQQHKTTGGCRGGGIVETAGSDAAQLWQKWERVFGDIMGGGQLAAFVLFGRVQQTMHMSEVWLKNSKNDSN